MKIQAINPEILMGVFDCNRKVLQCGAVEYQFLAFGALLDYTLCIQEDDIYGIINDGIEFRNQICDYASFILNLKKKDPVLGYGLERMVGQMIERGAITVNRLSMPRHTATVRGKESKYCELCQRVHYTEELTEVEGRCVCRGCAKVLHD